MKESRVLSKGQIIAILGSGFIGSMAYAFTDSFWFSAVEGEVYAMSSLFTAIIFWAIFKLNGTALTTYANSYTDREMSSTFLGPAKTLSQVDNSVVAKNDSVFQRL